MRQETFIAALL